MGWGTIRGHWRGQFDEDDQDEILLCGDDNSGGWFTVVHLTPEGALPASTQEATRSYVGGSVSPLHSYRLCAVADLDNDGRDDLVMAAPNVNQFSSVVIHRGLRAKGCCR